MGRPKGILGGTNRYWTKEEKLKAVKRVVDNHETGENVRKDLKINSGLLHSWIKRYLEEGLIGLENKIKPGSPYKGLDKKKNLTDLEQLQYENMKLRVENERWKKGYVLEGDGQTVIYDTSRFKNMK